MSVLDLCEGCIHISKYIHVLIQLEFCCCNLLNIVNTFRFTALYNYIVRIYCWSMRTFFYRYRLTAFFLPFFFYDICNSNFTLFALCTRCHILLTHLIFFLRLVIESDTRFSCPFIFSYIDILRQEQAFVHLKDTLTRVHIPCYNRFEIQSVVELDRVIEPKAKFPYTDAKELYYR